MQHVPRRHQECSEYNSKKDDIKPHNSRILTPLRGRVTDFVGPRFWGFANLTYDVRGLLNETEKGLFE